MCFNTFSGNADTVEVPSIRLRMSVYLLNLSREDFMAITKPLVRLKNRKARLHLKSYFGQ